MLFCAKLHYNVYAPRNKLTVITQRYIAKDIRLYFSVVEFIIDGNAKMENEIVVSAKHEV